jgi:cytochrome c6
MVALCAVAAPSLADGKKGQKIDAAAEFKKHCAVCHPDGGNIINKNKPIGKKALEANGIKSDKEIVAKMRKPGPGMTAFDAKTISDREAKAIADYILKTFK